MNFIKQEPADTSQFLSRVHQEQDEIKVKPESAESNNIAKLGNGGMYLWGPKRADNIHTQGYRVSSLRRLHRRIQQERT